MNKRTNTQDNRIPIYFTFDRYYVLAACVAIYSLMENASKDYDYDLYIVHDSLNRRDTRRIQKIVDKFSNATIEFVFLNNINSHWDNISTKSHFSKEIYYKLLAAEIFPQYDRIIFSDVDVVFLKDISAVYNMYKNEKFYFAGTPNMFDEKFMANYSKKYSPNEIRIIKNNEVSAGFMLINTKSLREDEMTKKLTKYYQDNAYRLFLPEQDCIALTCTNYIKILPFEYNISVTWYKNPLISSKLLLDCIQPIMLHYPGRDKPWNSIKTIKANIWLKYCMKARLLHKLIFSQPVFIYQRLKRFDCKRFLIKIKHKLND